MPSAPLSSPERLARIIDGLCNAVAARGVGGRLTSALLVLLWNRLRRAAIRVRRLGDRIADGASLVPGPRRAAPRPGGANAPHLPRGHAWLVRLAPGAAACGSQLQFLLAEPDMAALAHAPAMRRLLRPLCQMLGVPPPPVPKRPVVTSQSPPVADSASPPVRPKPRKRPERSVSGAVPDRSVDPFIASAVTA